MGGDELCLRACLQCELQQIPAVQAENGPAVGADISNGLQPGGKLVCGLQTGQKNDIVHLARFSTALVDRAYLARHHKARGWPRCRSGQAQLFFQPVYALSRRLKVLPQLLAPCGVGKIPCAQDVYKRQVQGEQDKEGDLRQSAAPCIVSHTVTSHFIYYVYCNI